MDDDWDPFDAGVEGSIFQSMWPNHRGMPSISKMIDAAERAGEAHVAANRDKETPGQLDNHWDDELWDDATLEAQGAAPPGYQPSRRQQATQAPQPPQAARTARTIDPDEIESALYEIERAAEDTPDWLKKHR